MSFPSLNFNSRTKVLKSKTSELKSMNGSVIETSYKGINDITLVTISEPNEQFLENINKEYNFHHLAIEDCLSEFQRSKVEPYSKYTHIILHFPIFEKDLIIPAEVNFFVSENYLVIVHWNNLPHLNHFVNIIINDVETKKECMESGTWYLLYKILDVLVNDTFPIIDKIEKRVRMIEYKIFDENNRDDRKIVRDIARLRRDILSLQRIIKPQVGVLSTLERIKGKYISSDLELYFGDIGDYVTKQSEIISDQNDLIINLNNTNESLISVRANNIMKALTIISVMMLPLNLLAGLYGMNIKLPISGYDYAFEVIVSLMFTVSVLMLLFFRTKKWF